MSRINGNGENNSELFPARKIKFAVEESLSILGLNLTEALIESLATNGIDLNSATLSYSLDQLQKQFDYLFGEDASQLLMGRLKDHLLSH